MSFISKLFKRKVPEIDIDKAVNEYLLKLPRCNRNVVIVSSKYGETHYTCEILVAADDLVPWAEHHADTMRSSNQEEQVARKALPIWLRGAKSEDNSASYVPHFMYEVLRPYVRNLVNKKITHIYCLECQSLVSDVQMEKLNEKRDGSWAWWTDVWRCPKGHQLYYEEHELHMLLRR